MRTENRAKLTPEQEMDAAASRYGEITRQLEADVKARASEIAWLIALDIGKGAKELSEESIKDIARQMTGDSGEPTAELGTRMRAEIDKRTTAAANKDAACASCSASVETLALQRLAENLRSMTATRNAASGQSELGSTPVGNPAIGMGGNPIVAFGQGLGGGASVSHDPPMTSNDAYDQAYGNPYASLGQSLGPYDARSGSPHHQSPRLPPNAHASGTTLVAQPSVGLHP